MGIKATRKLAISAFVCLNLAAVVLANRRPSLERLVDGLIQEDLGPSAARRLAAAGWLVQRYATAVGLDNRWEMFSFRPRARWRYRFTARYADGSSAVLPIPRGRERSFIQASYFDFREPKIQENISLAPEWLESYAGYLCRAFASRDGAAIRSIRVEALRQEIRERSEARRTGMLLEGPEESEVLEQVPCD